MYSFRLPDAPAKAPSKRPTSWVYHSVYSLSWKLSLMQHLLRISVFIHSEQKPTWVISLCQSHLSLASERSWAVGLGGSVWVSSHCHLVHCFCITLAPSSGKLCKIKKEWFTARRLTISLDAFSGCFYGGPYKSVKIYILYIKKAQTLHHCPLNIHLYNNPTAFTNAKKIKITPYSIGSQLTERQARVNAECSGSILNTNSRQRYIID